ncbi:hypothetical protein GC174_18545 [bacterium]|nr:hypothetical protein [bacterium]
MNESEPKKTTGVWRRRLGLLLAILVLGGGFALTAVLKSNPELPLDYTIDAGAPYEFDALKELHVVKGLSPLQDETQRLLSRTESSLGFARMALDNAAFQAEKAKELADTDPLKSASQSAAASASLRNAVKYLDEATGELAKAEDKFARLKENLAAIDRVAAPQALERINSEPNVANARIDSKTFTLMIAELKSQIAQSREAAEAGLKTGLK